MMLILFTGLTSTTAFAGSQSVVETNGIGISETKTSACELALDHARSEAAQMAITNVESSFTSIESSSGAMHVDSKLVTTKAFAKLINKTEKLRFDNDTGYITCEVNAKFKAGFVITSSPKTSPTHDQPEKIRNVKPKKESMTIVTASDFNGGEVFCPINMVGCYREFYSKELNKFGIQQLSSNRFDFLGRYRFFYKMKLLFGEYIEVTTKEGFLSVLDAYLEKFPSKKYLPQIKIKGYFWKKRGFVSDNFDKPIVGRWASDIGWFESEKTMSPEQIQKIDDDMKKIYSN